MLSVRRIGGQTFYLLLAVWLLPLNVATQLSAGEPTLAPTLDADSASRPQASPAMFKSAPVSSLDVPNPSEALSMVPPGEGMVPASLHDRGFDRYIDLRLLADAWAELDATRLTDAALQLAEGERILLRSHKAITAAEALQLAVKTANEQGDTETLARLEKVALARQDKALASMLGASRKLGGASRTMGPSIDLTTTTPTAFALLHACYNDLKRAKIAGDTKVLMALAQAIPAMPLLSDGQKEQLLATATAPVAESDQRTRQLSQTLRRLAAASRCDMKDPSCFPYLPTVAALEQASVDPSQKPEVRAAASTARERLAGAMRCDMQDPSCSP